MSFSLPLEGEGEKHYTRLQCVLRRLWLFLDRGQGFAHKAISENETF